MAEDVQMASAAEKWNGKADCMHFFQTLFIKRPDITFVLTRTNSGIYPHWNSAFETGSWTEAWTEKDGQAKIVGQYFVLWQYDNLGWRMRTAVFAPLDCLGDSKFCH